MKIFSKILSILLAFIIIVQTPMVIFAKQVTISITDGKKYTHQSQFDDAKILQGIDISSHNGEIEWNKVKKAGVEFVIIRAGYRGYAGSGKLCKDKKFADNAKGATQAGIPIGAYIYSQAITTSEAIAEANLILEQIKDFDITYPVIFDYEFADTSSGRLDKAWRNGKLNKTKMTAIADAFCTTIQKAGYQPMIYASEYFFYDQLDYTYLQDRYDIWLAHYDTRNTDYKGKFQMWQYTDEGKINGIYAPVDSIFCYKTYPTFETEKIYNLAYDGKAKTQNSMLVYHNDTLLTEGTDYTVEYKNNIAPGSAIINITGINDYHGLTAKRTFKIVPKAVTNLQRVSSTTNSVKIKWDPVPAATSYTVKVLRSTGWVTAGTTTDTSFNVTGLSNAGAYKFKVYATSTKNGIIYTSSASEEFGAATFPKKTTDFKATATSSSRATLTWSKQALATKYQIFGYNYATKEYVLKQEVEGGANNTITLSSLKNATNYKFKIRAVKVAYGKTYYGAFSDPIIVTTKPITPTITSAKSNYAKKIKVTWSEEKCSGYQVMWSTKKDFSSNTKSVYVSNSDTSTTLKTAKSNKRYYVKVRAYKTVDGTKKYSYWSDTLSVKTK